MYKKNKILFQAVLLNLLALNQIISRLIKMLDKILNEDD